MANDDLSLTTESDRSRSTALLPAAMAEHQSGEGGANPSSIAQPSGFAAPDLMVYVHAFRRHWLMSLGLGLLCATLLGPAVWFAVGPKYYASSFLRISMQEQFLVPGQRDMLMVTDRDRFEIYKNTQAQLVVSRFVLTAALRKPEVAKLASVQAEQRSGDPITWLLKKMGVGFPGKAEIMEVSISREDPNEAAILVSSVVNSYLTEVVNAEREQKRQRLSDLDRIYAEREEEVRKKRTELKDLAETLGTSETETLTLKQKLALEELALLRQEMVKTQFDVRRLQSELAGKQALMKTVDTMEIPSADVDMMVMTDPVARQLFTELGWKKMDQVYTGSVAKAGVKTRYADRFGTEIDMLQQQYEARVEELQKAIRQKTRSKLQMEIDQLQTSVAVMVEQERLVAEDVQKQRKMAEQFGSSSIDVEMMRADIKHLDDVLAGVANEREKLKVEVRSPARVSLLMPADVPDSESNRFSRMALTALMLLAGMCCPAAIAILWDCRAKRINSSVDVAKGLRLPVIGSVPKIPSRVIGKLGSPSKRSQSWNMRLTESIDGITARVLHKAEIEQCRVLMVSSAVGGEGKTTLATQLALSLARAGRRTVLVDFDLRRPSFDEVFGLPLEPGVCEVLQRQSELPGLVHQTATGNLAVVTAGRWSRHTMASLSNGAAAAMFKELREEFDFVVVDTSPILPVADARFVSQYVDSVVLSIFRDVSEAPKIQAACEILAAFGVRSIEAVVTGQNDNRYGERTAYESTVSS